MLPESQSLELVRTSRAPAVGRLTSSSRQPSVQLPRPSKARLIAMPALAASLLLTLSLPAAQAQQQPAPSASVSTLAAALPREHRSSKDRRAAEKAYLEGAKALDRQDLHAAVRAFSRAAELDPDNRDYAEAVQIARGHLVTELVQQANKARILNQPAVARARLAEALELDPNNPIAAQHLDDLANLALEPHATEGPTADVAGAIELTPAPDKHSFHLRVPSQALLRQVLTAYGVDASLDPTVQGVNVRFDADNVDYEQAATLLRLATNTFFVPLDPRRVLVAKDTRENREKYQRMLLETVYLPGLTATEMSDMGNLARNVFEAQQATVQPSYRTLTVRAPEPKLAALNRTLADLLDGKSQLLLEVRLFEIAKTKTTNIGVQLPQQFNIFNVPTELNSIVNGNQDLINQIVSSGLAPAGDTAAIVAILIASGQVSGSILNQPFATFGGGSTLTGLTIGTTTANLALNSSDTRALDQIQLRMQDLEPATIMAGSRYPIIQSSYSNLSGVGANIPGLNTAGLSSQLAALGLGGSTSELAQQAIPAVQYEDLGLTLKATPRILRNDNIGLKLEFKLQALGGQSLNSIPVLTNRQFTANLNVLDGESTLVTSTLSRSEARAVSGVPGISELPGFQSGTDQTRDFNIDELVVLVTPHIVRKRHTDLAGPVLTMPTHQ